MRPIPQFAIVLFPQSNLWGKQRRPIQGNPASDRMLRGPDCNRHSRVCADASTRTGLPRRSMSDGHRYAFSRHYGIYQSDVTCILDRTEALPPDSRSARARQRTGRITSSSSSR